MPTLMFIYKESLDSITDKIREILGVANRKFTVPSGIVSGIVDCNKKGKDTMLKKTFTNYDYANDGYEFPKLGKYAFAGNTNLTTVVLERGNTVSDYCFLDCINLSSVSFKNNYGSSTAFVPRATACFKGCTSLQNITIAGDPIGGGEVGDEAFSGCSSLRQVKYFNYPVEYYSIGRESFLNCSSLTSYYLGSYIRSVGNSAFMNSGLTSLTIDERYANSLTLGEYAFAGCTDLTSVNISSVHNISYGSHCFDGDTSLETVVLSPKTTSIPSYCFNNCTSLRSIIIPATCTSIGDYAFNGCTALEEVIFANDSTLNSIGVRAFMGCTSLVNITVPSTVTSIGTYAFANCSAMSYCRLIPTTPPTIGSYIYYNTINNPLTIYVPDSEEGTVLAAYQNATNWKISSYKSRMAVWQES